MVRNSDIGGANGCDRPMAASGTWCTPASRARPRRSSRGQCQQNTVLPTSPVAEEAPFLYQNADGNYEVFVPAVQHNSAGPVLGQRQRGRLVDSVVEVLRGQPEHAGAGDRSARWLVGKDLILTPGVYNLDQPIVVSRPDTVVLGLGFATLVPQHGNAAMIVAPNDGVKLSGLIVDAGPVTRRCCCQWASRSALSHGSNPDTIQDVFFRIGGAETTNVSATVSLLDNAEQLDHRRRLGLAG